MHWVTFFRHVLFCTGRKRLETTTARSVAGFSKVQPSRGFRITNPIRLHHHCEKFWELQSKDDRVTLGGVLILLWAPSNRKLILPLFTWWCRRLFLSSCPERFSWISSRVHRIRSRSASHSKFRKIHLRSRTPKNVYSNLCQQYFSLHLWRLLFSKYVLSLY